MVHYGFQPSKGGGVELTFRREERMIVDDLLGELLALVAPEHPADADPLAALMGIGTATQVPDDPVLARLFPDAYRDDSAAAGEFRRYTELGLRDRKHAAALLARGTLSDSEQGRLLTHDETMAWLGALNDLRLALGTRLGVTEELEQPDEEDPRWFSFAVYEWLGEMQECLVHCLN